MKNRSFVEWMYSTKTGRAFLKIMLYSGILKAAEKLHVRRFPDHI